MIRRTVRLAAMFLVLALPAGGTHAAQESVPPSDGEGWASLFSPAENGLVVGRKPAIRGTFLKEVVPETILIYIDGTDYTAVAAKTSRGFEVKPPLPLPPGIHQIMVMAQDGTGEALQYSASFSSKHTEAFDEVGSSSHLSAVYDYTVHEPSPLEETVPDWNVDVNLTTGNIVRKGPWKVSLDGVARYKDRDLAIPEPERRGADVVSYTGRAGYEKGEVRAEAAVGDVVVDQTPYTVASLARKGAVFTGDVGFLALDVFSVRGDAVYGTRGGLSLDGGTDGHIRGGSGTIRLFSNRLAVKTVYVDGGEDQPSFNIGTTGGGRKGEVLGVRMTTDFFSGKFRTDFEVDFSEFTPDTQASVPETRKDHAIRVGAAGAAGIYTYEALFEHVGRDYEVIGNQGLPKNRQGGKVGGSASFGTQTLGLGVSRYNDNVEDDPLLPTDVQWEANLSYGLSRWAAFPVYLTYRFAHQESDEPEGTPEKSLEKVSHDVNGQVSWIRGVMNAVLSGGYANTDDRTAIGADTTAWNVRLVPAFAWPTFSLAPSAAYNEYLSGQVRTETTTLGLDGRAQFFGARVTAEAGGAWTFTDASDRSQDNRAVNGTFRLAYNPGPFLSGRFVPQLAFRGVYDRFDDRITPASDRDHWTLFLTITAEIPVVL